MNGIKRVRANYAAVTSTLALALALGMGGAYAASKITSKDVAKSAVTSKHIKDGQVKTADLAPDTEVASAKTAKTAESAKRADTASAVAPNSVNSASIADGTVGTADLAGDSVNGTKIAPAAVANGDLADNAVNGLKIADGTINGSDLSSGSVGTDELISDSVNANALAPASVGPSELGIVRAVVGRGQGVPGGAVGTTNVTCPEGTIVIAGGFAWHNAGATSIVTSAPSEVDPDSVWVVAGRNASGETSNTLYAWANCLGG